MGGSGPGSIGQGLHFSRVGRPGTSVWSGWYLRTGGGAGRRRAILREPMRDPVKVMIVDDHPVFREGLRQALEARKTIRVIATAGSGEEMGKALRAHGRPQIVLMDVEMPGESGIELTRALHEKRPEVRVVMLTAFSDSERVFAALKAGAVGYLLKNVAPDEIRATVERAAAGEPMLSGEIAGRVLREFEREREEERYREQLDALTAREEEILKLLATGESNREIGRRLPIIGRRRADPCLASALRALVPARWRDRLVGASVGGAGAVASLFWIREWSGRAAAAAEWASFALGLAVRWWVVSRLVPGGDVTGHPAAIAVAELAGYLAWAPMAALPIYSYRPFLPPAPAFRGLQTVIQDLQLVFIVTLTPLVFLIVYGYATHGLAGAAVWSLAALGLHVMLKRLTERRYAAQMKKPRLLVRYHLFRRPPRFLPNCHLYFVQ